MKQNRALPPLQQVLPAARAQPHPPARGSSIPWRTLSETPEVEMSDRTAPFSAPSAGPPPWHLYRFRFRFFQRAVSTTKVTPVEVVTDHAATYPMVLEELLPTAWRRTERKLALRAGRVAARAARLTNRKGIMPGNGARPLRTK